VSVVDPEIIADWIWYGPTKDGVCVDGKVVDVGCVIAPDTVTDAEAVVFGKVIVLPLTDVRVYVPFKEVGVTPAIITTLPATNPVTDEAVNVTAVPVPVNPPVGTVFAVTAYDPPVHAKYITAPTGMLCVNAVVSVRVVNGVTPIIAAVILNVPPLEKSKYCCPNPTPTDEDVSKGPEIPVPVPVRGIVNTGFTFADMLTLDTFVRVVIAGPLTVDETVMFPEV
jgi:hypothetical protein